MLKNPYIRTFLLTVSLCASASFTALVVPGFVGAAVSASDPSLSTTSQGYIYLSQVPYTGFGDFMRLLGFIVVVGLWSLLVVMIIKNDKVKAMLKRAFRNVDEEARLGAQGTGGYIFDVNGNQLLNMNLNPVHDSMPEHFIKHNFAENGGNNGNGRREEPIIPPRDENAYTLNNEQKNNGGDLVTDVNAFVNLVVRGDTASVFDHLRKMKSKGIDASDFATAVVLELDAAYRAKLDGDNNKRNIVLSQIITHWSRSKIESVIASLLSIVDRSYSDPNVGLKVALMRMMRAV